MECKGEPRILRMEDVRRAFPQYSSCTVRRPVRDCAKFLRDAQSKYCCSANPTDFCNLLQCRRR
ncbi:unnamed protein product [Soboliphyme baturini]|uniref:AAI domain-containing protein n=1 Tax=Soboliphyme baturini TaxID=241478 RepID=A0A183JBE4_9BILA|nr:unnamed protein product [Soboliphyme baturini]